MASTACGGPDPRPPSPESRVRRASQRPGRACVSPTMHCARKQPAAVDEGAGESHDQHRLHLAHGFPPALSPAIPRPAAYIQGSTATPTSHGHMPHALRHTPSRSNSLISSRTSSARSELALSTREPLRASTLSPQPTPNPADVHHAARRLNQAPSPPAPRPIQQPPRRPSHPALRPDPPARHPDPPHQRPRGYPRNPHPGRPRRLARLVGPPAPPRPRRRPRPSHPGGPARPRSARRGAFGRHCRRDDLARRRGRHRRRRARPRGRRRPARRAAPRHRARARRPPCLGRRLARDA